MKKENRYWLLEKFEYLKFEYMVWKKENLWKRLLFYIISIYFPFQ